jgi:hypothetical protein
VRRVGAAWSWGHRSVPPLGRRGCRVSDACRCPEDPAKTRLVVDLTGEVGCLHVHGRSEDDGASPSQLADTSRPLATCLGRSAQTCHTRVVGWRTGEEQHRSRRRAARGGVRVRRRDRGEVHRRLDVCPAATQQMLQLSAESAGFAAAAEHERRQPAGRRTPVMEADGGEQAGQDRRHRATRPISRCR